METNDVKTLLKELEGKEYSNWNKHCCKAILKSLLRSLGKPEEMFNWIKTRAPPAETVFLDWKGLKEIR